VEAVGRVTGVAMRIVDEGNTEEGTISAPLRECLAFQMLHHQIISAALLPDVEQSADLQGTYYSALDSSTAQSYQSNDRTVHTRTKRDLLADRNSEIGSPPVQFREEGESMNRWITLAALSVLIANTAVAQTQAKKEPASTTGSEKPKFKAIFEPVNYPQDSELRDVFFVSADVGWVAGMTRSDAGEGGMILHTADGGKHWDVQVGDPHSGTRAFEQLYFLDATHGWATEDGDGGLLRTTDGQTWENVSAFSAGKAFVFSTPDVGVYLDGDKIFRSKDGGRSWTQVYACRTRVEVDGLAREVQCNFQSVCFPTPQIGYATTVNLPDKSSGIAKTEDGGLTWDVTRFVPNASAGDRGGVFFTDANTGFIRTYDHIFATSDGAQTWHGTTAMTLNGPIRFADHQVGWVARGTRIAYTSDGGKRWNTAEIRFPAEVFSSSLPLRDRGYVVGEHEMIYRYRIVPIDYSVKGMISAPAIAAP
jgi:photosystem II stability/assembly factor-like uncharacterized protein